jgi:hypothetical protein
LGGLLVLSQVGNAGSVVASEETPEDLIVQGVKLRRQGHDQQAEGYFRRAYELAHTPRSAAQLALVELALGQFWRAEKHFGEAFNGDDSWIRSQKKTLESARKTARKHLGQLRLSGVVDGLVLEIYPGEGARSETTPVATDGRVFLPEGSVTVRATAPDVQPLERSFTVMAGESLDWRLEWQPVPKKQPGPLILSEKPRPNAAPPLASPRPKAPPPSPSPPPPEPDSGRALRYTGIALVGVGAGATIGGFLLRSVAASKLDHIRNASKDMTAYNPEDGNWKTFDRLGIGLIAGGVTTIVGGAVLYLVNRSSEQGESATSANNGNLTVTLAPSAEGPFFGAWREVVTLQGRF